MSRSVHTTEALPVAVCPTVRYEPDLPGLSEASFEKHLPRCGENARLSIKRDSYADFSLCANASCLLGSDPIVSWLSRLFLTSHWLSSPLLRQRAFHPPLKRQGRATPVFCKKCQAREMSAQQLSHREAGPASRE